MKPSKQQIINVVIAFIAVIVALRYMATSKHNNEPTLTREDDGCYLVYHDGNVARLMKLGVGEEWSVTTKTGTLKHDPDTQRNIIMHENVIDAPKRSPWTVVCDEKSGKFTFTRDHGEVWIDEFDTWEAANEYMIRVKQSDDELDARAEAHRAHREAIQKKNWQLCPTKP